MIGIISDDLTGANGVAAMFAVRGVQTLTVLVPPAVAAARLGAGVVVVDTATRDATAVEAYAAARTATEHLLAAGARFVAKRIDTTLRGNLGVEIRALLDALDADPTGAAGRTVAVVVPAAPEAGRIALGGRVYLGVPDRHLPPSAAGRADPPTLAGKGDGGEVSFKGARPLSDVTGGPDRPAALIAEQARLPAALVSIEVVRRGPEAVAAALMAACRSGVRVTVWDAVTVEDVETIAQGVADSDLSAVPVDPGGFTVMMAAAHGLIPGQSGLVARVEPDTPPAAEARVLAVLGSRAAIAAEQARVAVARGLLSVVTLDARAALAGAERAEREVRRVVSALEAAPVPIVGVRAEPFVEGGTAPVGSAAGRIAARLAEVVARSMSTTRPPTALYLSGGAAARAVLDRLGATAVAVHGAVLPLAATGRLADGPHANVPIVTKGGMIGGDDALAACLGHLLGARVSPGGDAAGPLSLPTVPFPAGGA